MKSLPIVALALALAFGTAATAQDDPGMYGGVSLGTTLINNQSVTSGGTTGVGSYDLGFSVLGAIGYNFGNNARTELELGYGSSKIDDVSVADIAFDVTGGGIDLFTGHVAAYYDIPFGLLNPYLGAGLGFTYSERDTASTAGITVPGESATNFSLFGEVGAMYEATENFSIGPSVRYMWLNNGGGGVEANTGWIFKVGTRFAF